MRNSTLALLSVVLFLSLPATGAQSAPKNKDFVTILAVGDVAVCEESWLAKALRGVLGSFNDPGALATGKMLDSMPGRILGLGDMSNEGGLDADFAKCYDKYWGRHKARTFPIPGNHEYRTANALPFYAYFGGNAGQSRQGYFSFNLGAWHIIGLNSNIGNGIAAAEQELWLRADIAATNLRCVLAYWHHPMFSSSTNDTPPEQQATVARLYRILYDEGVSVVLAGHVHTYERFAPLDPGGNIDLRHGIRTFVVGTGGAQLKRPLQTARHSETGMISVHGILEMRLFPNGYQWNFKGVDRMDVKDRGSSRCIDRSLPRPLSRYVRQVNAEADVDLTR